MDHCHVRLESFSTWSALQDALQLQCTLTVVSRRARRAVLLRYARAARVCYDRTLICVCVRVGGAGGVNSGRLWGLF